MISMYAEYSGRTLYVALSSDTIDGAKNGDTLYEMDTGKRYVYNESNDAWDEQPEEGGGGGGEQVHIELVPGNGTSVLNVSIPFNPKILIVYDIVPIDTNSFQAITRRILTIWDTDYTRQYYCTGATNNASRGGYLYASEVSMTYNHEEQTLTLWNTEVWGTNRDYKVIAIG